MIALCTERAVAVSPRWPSPVRLPSQRRSVSPPVHRSRHLPPQPLCVRHGNSEPAPEPVAGDVLSADEAEQINAAWGRMTDDKAYQLPTGEWILIKGNEPLPASVAQAVETAVIPPYSAHYATAEFDAARAKAANAALDAQEAATGRKIILVIHRMNAVNASGEEARWSVAGDTAGHNGPSKDEAMAMAQKWIDKSPNTRILIVVDAVG